MWSAIAGPREPHRQMIFIGWELKASDIHRRSPQMSPQHVIIIEVSFELISFPAHEWDS